MCDLGSDSILSSIRRHSLHFSVPGQGCISFQSSWSVYISVCLLPRFLPRNKPAKTRHQQVQRYTGLILNVAIFVKALCSRVMGWKPSHQANMQNSTGLHGSARSVYLEGTRNHNEGHVSTPTCYLLLSLARVSLWSVSYKRETTNRPILNAQPINY